MKTESLKLKRELGLIAWVITSIGSILLALSFAKLGSAIPEIGGPIVYTREAFVVFAAFLIAWIYWIGIWVGDAAIITAITSYLTYLFSIIGENRLLAFSISSAILWIFTFINVRGVKEAGAVSLITSIFKILPLIIFAAIASLHLNSNNFATAASESTTGFSTLPAAVRITLWSFSGLESATIPAGEIKNPRRNIKLSTILGTSITAVIYILISILAIGAMPQDKLAASKAPLAEIINASTGTSLGTNVILITSYVNTLTSAFNFILLLSTLAILPVYTFTAASEIMLLRKSSDKFKVFSFIKNSFLALLAVAYSIYAIYGTGAQIVMYGFILILIGIPFYIFIKLQNKVEKQHLNS